MHNVSNEGPYIFYENHSILNINYVKENKVDGFYVDSKEYAIHSEILMTSNFQSD
jgi:hypothetical protein